MKAITINKAILFLIFMVIWQTASSQLSPGDLAAVHAHLEGTANCTKCHDLGDKVSNAKCLDCHKEIKARLELNKGYHALEEVKKQDCFICHNDHHGRNFQIIRFDKNTFNHNLTGYQLQGSHKLVSCKECHKPSNILDPDLKKKDITYLGLGTSCLSCHKDHHQGSLSQNCLDCHDQNKFVPAVNFNHASTNFPLRGMHREVACAKCHGKVIQNDKEFVKYRGIEHANCYPCHEDVHKHKFGQDCKRCHTEESFHVLRNQGSLDHNLTNFPLIGKHRTVDCKACHKSNYTTPIVHNNCMDCHADYHEGQFEKAGVMVACDQCHDMNGFTPSTYTLEDHQQTSFRLEGAHLATPCFMCHATVQDKKWQFADLGNECFNCHDDIHRGQIDTIYYPGSNCLKCHRVSQWSDIGFEHDLTGYKLEGAHSRQGCRDCHFIDDEQGNFKQQFNTINSACLNCHKDIHYAQFEEYGEKSCLRCHGYEKWLVSGFNHDNTNFRLDGKHSGLQCLQCHKQEKKEDLVYTLYKIENYRCEDCH